MTIACISYKSYWKNRKCVNYGVLFFIGLRYFHLKIGALSFNSSTHKSLKDQYIWRYVRKLKIEMENPQIFP